MRSIFLSFRIFFLLRMSSRCHEIASPSRSGSVAKMTLSAFLISSAMAATCFAPRASISQSIAKSSSGSTDPSFGGKSRT